MIYIGIDPGVSGGIAALTDRGMVIDTHAMPRTDRDVYDVLRDYVARVSVEGPAQAMLERVAASPQMGVVSAFTFGKGYGALLMALTAWEIRFDQVTPARWQQALGCLSRGDKNVTKRRAQQLFPHLTITHAIADALLIAEYGRRLHTGILARKDSRNVKEAKGQRHEEGNHALPSTEARDALGVAIRAARDYYATAPRTEGASAAGDGTGAQPPARCDLRGARRNPRSAVAARRPGEGTQAARRPGPAR